MFTRQDKKRLYSSKAMSHTKLREFVREKKENANAIESLHGKRVRFVNKGDNNQGWLVVWFMFVYSALDGS